MSTKLRTVSYLSITYILSRNFLNLFSLVSPDRRTIILRDMRTVASAQHRDLLLYFSNIIISAFKINLDRQSTSFLRIENTSLIATTSPVSILTALNTTPKDPFPTCSSNLNFEASILSDSVDKRLLGYCGFVDRVQG